MEIYASFMPFYAVLRLEWNKLHALLILHAKTESV